MQLRREPAGSAAGTVREVGPDPRSPAAVGFAVFVIGSGYFVYLHVTTPSVPGSSLKRRGAGLLGADQPQIGKLPDCRQ